MKRFYQFLFSRLFSNQKQGQGCQKEQLKLGSRVPDLQRYLGTFFPYRNSGYADPEFTVFRRCNGAKGSENIKKRPASFENKCTPKYLCGSSSRCTLVLGRDSDRCVYPGGVRQDQKACAGFFGADT